MQERRLVDHLTTPETHRIILHLNSSAHIQIILLLRFWNYDDWIHFDPKWMWSTSEKFISIFGRHLYLWLSILEKRRDPHLYLGVRSIPLIRSRCKDPLHLIVCIYFKFIITFSSWFVMGKTLWWGNFSKSRVGLGYHIVLGPLVWECTPPWALPYTKTISQKFPEVLKCT